MGCLCLIASFLLRAPRASAVGGQLGRDHRGAPAGQSQGWLGVTCAVDQSVHVTCTRGLVSSQQSLCSQGPECMSSSLSKERGSDQISSKAGSGLAQSLLYNSLRAKAVTAQARCRSLEKQTACFLGVGCLVLYKEGRN